MYTTYNDIWLKVAKQYTMQRRKIVNCNYCISWLNTCIYVMTTKLLQVFTLSALAHWDRVTHICANRLTIIGSDNDLSSGRGQSIIWTNNWISIIRTIETNYNEIVSEIRAFSFKKIYMKMSAIWRQFCLGLSLLMHFDWITIGSSGNKEI